MLRLASLALGLLSVIAIAPQSQAMAANVDGFSIQRPVRNIQIQQGSVKIADNERSEIRQERRVIRRDRRDIRHHRREIRHERREIRHNHHF